MIFELKKKLKGGEFFRKINNKPMACNLFEVYCKQQQDYKTLNDFYLQDDRRVEHASIYIIESYEQEVIYNIYLFINR